jgi:hypothetical protein
MIKLRYHLDRAFREKLQNGNFYEKDDYAGKCRQLFEHFGVNFDSVALHRGYSTDKAIIEKMTSETFHIVYVDGDHTFAGALHDFNSYGRKVVLGGFLIADDAGCSLPGTAFWKGHESVSLAAEALPGLGFRNVLNVGHNRIYERVGEFPSK